MPDCKIQAKIHAKLKKAINSKIAKNDDINYKIY